MDIFENAWTLLKNGGIDPFAGIEPSSEGGIDPFAGIEPSSEEKHLGVVGSRNLRNYPAFEQKVNEWIDENGKPHSIISGGQR